jgi:hypothetical protein
MMTEICLNLCPDQKKLKIGTTKANVTAKAAKPLINAHLRFFNTTPPPSKRIISTLAMGGGVA